MARFVRQSKFRHVFGSQGKPEQSYLDLKITRGAWDSNKVYCSSKFIATIWEARGGGSFCVLPFEQTGKLKPGQPLYSGHKAGVLDLDFCPFNDNVIASSSDDAYAKIWAIPDGGLKETCREAAQNLVGHRRKVGTVNWNPVANNVIATTSIDYSVKIWDVETGSVKLDIPGHKNIIQSFNWNWNGTQFATSSKDKLCRIFDARGQKEVAQLNAHDGTKGARVLWLGEKNKLFTCGFSRMSERQMRVFDPRDTSKPLFAMSIDTSSGMLIPFYDNDCSIVFLAGKGDGNIRYYEVTDDKKIVYFINDWKSRDPTLGMGQMPKYSLDIAECEVVRFMKGTNRGVVPVSFKVPRKSDLFQDDIFPDTAGQEPALDSAAWFGGASAEPKKVSLAPGFKPKPKPAAALAVKKVEEKKELSPAELKSANERLEKRVSYLESLLVKNNVAFNKA